MIGRIYSLNLGDGTARLCVAGRAEPPDSGLASENSGTKNGQVFLFGDLFEWLRLQTTRLQLHAAEAEATESSGDAVAFAMLHGLRRAHPHLSDCRHRAG